MMKTISVDGLKLNFDGEAKNISWLADGTRIRSVPNSDFWRIYLEDLPTREVRIHSSMQSGKIIKMGEGFDIYYDKLVSYEGKEYDIELTIHITKEDALLTFCSTIKNNSEHRVNEIKLPYLDFEHALSDEHNQDVYYRGTGMGEKIKNPWAALESSHTEYMKSDDRDIWSSTLYPSFGFMPWGGLEGNGKFLYMGRHDLNFRMCVLSVGRNPRNTDPRLLLSVSHFPVVAYGETETTGKVVLKLLEGNWKEACKLYRTWAEGSWWTPPTPKKWVKNMTGWQRIILKHQYGEVFFKYSDLPKVYLTGKKHGLDTLMVFGWWKGCFDNGYPVYEADEELGGAEGLKLAIKEVQKLGGHVILYSNGVLIDMTSNLYKEKGEDIAMLNIHGIPYRDNYSFSGDGMMFRFFEHKSFAIACQSTPEWQEKLIEVGAILKSFEPDAIFYDQLGYMPSLCFNKNHPHRTRADRDPEYRIENIKRIKNFAAPSAAFATEYAADIITPYMDFQHGCGFASYYDENAFPELYRQTFPEVIVSNRVIHDEREDYKKQLTFAFVYGYRFDVAPFRCRADISAVPEYGKYVEKLLTMKEKYHSYFYEGRFNLKSYIELPDNVSIAQYEASCGELYIFWNKGKNIVEFKALSRVFSLEGNEVSCVEILQP